MTEREYVNLSCLQRLRMAQRILGEVPAAQHPDVLDEHEFGRVMYKLDIWIAKLENTIHCKEDAE